ncbi:MAG: sigma 54-interacting transcriptional regulator [Polyangiaceae bacterium]
MSPDEIRRIRGPLSRPAFARLLGVTALTVLRWELPLDDKESRRPRAKMVAALQKFASAGPPLDHRTESGEIGGGSKLELDPKDEAVLRPLLEELCGERWRRAEESLTALLTTNGLSSPGGRRLATLGLVQVQVLAHMDLRGALAVLVPILDEVERGELSDEIAGRAHVMATFVYSAPDSRVHDLGRVNAHADRAEVFLGENANDLRVMCATSCIAAARYLGPEVTLHAYAAHLEHLEQARSPLARMLADALAGLVATVRGDLETSARLGGRALEAAEAMGHWGLVMGVLSDYAHRTLRGSQTPGAVLGIAQHGRERALAASLQPTEGFIRLLAAECEALCRASQLEAAVATAHEAIALAERRGLARYSLTAPLARLYVLTDSETELEDLLAFYDQEASGPQHAAARIHASYLRGQLLTAGGKFAEAGDSFDVVCNAPDTTLGLEYLVHAAHGDAVSARLRARDLDAAEAALRRFEKLLVQKPSVWHSVRARRSEALLLTHRGRHAEARVRVESNVATYQLLGDTTQLLLEEAARALLEQSAGAAGAELRVKAAFAKLSDAGFGPNYLQRLARAFANQSSRPLPELTTAEKLVVAGERLSIKGLEADAYRSELSAVLAFLFPGFEALVGGPELADTETTLEVPGAGEALWIGVRASLDAEQRAFLTLLSGIASRYALQEAPTIEPEIDVDEMLPEFVAASPPMRKLKQEIQRLSRSSATILVNGESGSGKEVVSRAIHDVSPRKCKPYVTFNCASVPRDLFEGQLFGYRKGAFTGATSNSPGVIRAADGGTLFLDEIGELPLEMQPKLLRFLENGEVLPLGEVTPVRVDVRVVAATHRDLAKLVREQHFREDLFYRLNVVPIRVPPLRERRDDVLALARVFVARLAEPGAQPPTLGRSAIAALQEHDWPGNVRELRNVIERVMAYSPVPRELRGEHLRITES